ncbi:hypothetical protein CsSME_00003636 [Camellia sinensis var. sinensis]
MEIAEEAHNVKVLGLGEKTIVLAHDDYKVILFNNMGVGTTNPEYFDFERYSSLEGYALDVLAILVELRVELGMAI